MRETVTLIHCAAVLAVAWLGWRTLALLWQLVRRRPVGIAFDAAIHAPSRDADPRAKSAHP